jgi:hypothetical protein
MATFGSIKTEWHQITSQPTQFLTLDFPEDDGRTIHGEGFFHVSVMPRDRFPQFDDDGYFFCFPIILTWSPKGFKLEFKNTRELEKFERVAIGATSIHELSVKLANAIASERKSQRWEQEAINFWCAVEDQP